MFLLSFFADPLHSSAAAAPGEFSVEEAASVLRSRSNVAFIMRPLAIS